MQHDAVELILKRNIYYMQNFRRMLVVVFVLFIMCLLLTGFVIYQDSTLKPMPRYFPTTPDGRLINTPKVGENHLILQRQKVSPITGKIEDMPEPAVPYAVLESMGEHGIVKYWASLAVQSMFSLDFVHYRKAIQEVRGFFTGPGHSRFIKALTDSKNLETVRANNSVIVPVTGQDIKILRTYYIYGHYAWDVLVPVTLKFENANQADDIILQWDAKLSIARVSTLKNPFYGLAIFKVNFTPASNPS